MICVTIVLVDCSQRNYISPEQQELLNSYFEDPFECMRSWVRANPAFIESALNSDDEKTKLRAEKLTGENLYNL